MSQLHLFESNWNVPQVLVNNAIGGEFQKISRIKPCSTLRKTSLEILETFETTCLLVENKEDDIYYGDIVCKKGNSFKSLRTELIEAGLIEINEVIFQSKLYMLHLYISLCSCVNFVFIT